MLTHDWLTLFLDLVCAGAGWAVGGWIVSAILTGAQNAVKRQPAQPKP
jgi:hypothetical protein